MRDFELMYALDAALTDENLDSVNQNIKKQIEDRKGLIKSSKEFGRRKLAYPIKKKNEGNYYLINFGIEPQKIEEIKRYLAITEAVLRWMIVKKSPEAKKEGV